MVGELSLECSFLFLISYLKRPQIEYILWDVGNISYELCLLTSIVLAAMILKKGLKTKQKSWQFINDEYMCTLPARQLQGCYMTEVNLYHGDSDYHWWCRLFNGFKAVCWDQGWQLFLKYVAILFALFTIVTLCYHRSCSFIVDLCLFLTTEGIFANLS